MKLFSLIKSGTIHFSKKTKIIPQKEYSTLLKAQDIVKQAEEDALQLLNETKEECDLLRKKAKETGLQNGLDQFNQQLLFMSQQIKQLRLELQQQVLPLALKTAKKIVGEELSINPETIVNIVQQVIRPITQCHNVKIFVHKGDMGLLENKKNDLKNLFERLETFSIEERSDIDAGSCIIETEVGIINATLDNQWRALEAAFESFAKKK
ncbi:MAG: HrpE/YscL family type III secretion apparatus protein [Chlamydiales bacterium]|nr:HrpE/YscL family type III secretion apparatus protein [Chlamydiales bacterium]